jgi:hypothetical protein
VDDRGLVDDEAAVIGGGQAGRGSEISRSTGAHNSSLMSHGGEEDAGEDVRRTLPRRVGPVPSPTIYFLCLPSGYDC